MSGELRPARVETTYSQPDPVSAYCWTIGFMTFLVCLAVIVCCCVRTYGGGK